MTSVPGPFVLIILDGWGVAPASRYNAISQASTPHYSQLLSDFPWTQIQASEQLVGLPHGQIGNSEVGHMNIGSGRVVHQDIVRISDNIESGGFFDNPVLVKAFERARDKGTQVHLLGLVSDGGVHSLQAHLHALLDMARRQNVEKTFVHAIFDGRDTPPQSGKGYLEELLQEMKNVGAGHLATLSGRYYTMDRDTRWDRTERAYRMLTAGQGKQAADPMAALQASYDEKVNDEFVEPVVLTHDGKPVATIQDGDSVIFFNFRADRTRQITAALTQDGFEGFSREQRPRDLYFACMTEYSEDFDLPAAYPPVKLVHPSGELFAERKLRQLRIAETEKYAHVTYFFNGGREQPFELEDRIMVPSPRVATYDLQPEMSAPEVTERLEKAIRSGQYALIVVNYANADLVGHTGDFDAAVRAVEVIDECLGRVTSAALEMGGAFFLTADHGNIEKMWDEETSQIHTAHTTNPVPFIYGVRGQEPRLREDGVLADIMPTALGLLGISAPQEMGGRDLRR